MIAREQRHASRALESIAVAAEPGGDSQKRTLWSFGSKECRRYCHFSQADSKCPSLEASGSSKHEAVKVVRVEIVEIVGDGGPEVGSGGVSVSEVAERCERWICQSIPMLLDGAGTRCPVVLLSAGWITGMFGPLPLV